MTGEEKRSLLRHDEHLAVVRLGPGTEVPDWATSGVLLSVTATRDETSVVCSAAGVPRKAQSEGPYLPFEVAGPLDPSLTGVLSGLLAPLAEERVPVFTLSTYDTDWVLVRAEDAGRAEDAWRTAGHDVRSFSSEGQE